MTLTSPRLPEKLAKLRPPFAQCRTKADVLIEWTDARPEPIQAEVDAVTDLQIDDAIKQANADSLYVSPEFVAIVKVINKILDGTLTTPLNKAQWLTRLNAELDAQG